jgi:hypothetical protein
LDPTTGAVLTEIEIGPENIRFPNAVIFNKDETVMFFTEDDGDSSVRAYSLENLSAATPMAAAPAAPAAAPMAPPSTAGSPTTAASPAVPLPPQQGTSEPDLLWERLFGLDEALALFYQPSDDTLLLVYSEEIEKLSAADGSTLSSFGTPTFG